MDKVVMMVKAKEVESIIWYLVDTPIQSFDLFRENQCSLVSNLLKQKNSQALKNSQDKLQSWN